MNARNKGLLLVRCAGLLACTLLACGAARATSLHGKAIYAGRGLPGVQITIQRGNKAESAISNEAGEFQFIDLADGMWTIDASMQCFEKLHLEVNVALDAKPLQLEMKLLPTEKLAELTQPSTPAASSSPERPAVAESAGVETTQAALLQSKAPARKSREAQGTDQAQPDSPTALHEENDEGADGFLVQGSVNNASTSAFSTNPAFGNMRGKHDLYTGELKITLDSSSLDAQPYSLSGVSTARPEFNNTIGNVRVQGPFKLPHLISRGPNVFLGYNWARLSRVSMMNGIVPTAEDRSGNLAGLTNALGQPLTIYDPATGSTFAGNQVPVRPEAAALLKLFPLPNLTGASKYNYQAQILNDSRQDGVDLNLNGRAKRAGYLFGGFGINSGNSDNTNLFGFLDRTNTMNTRAAVGWNNWFQHLGMYAHAHYSFNRYRTTQTPYFANRENVSGNAGIGGNDKNSANWGPPSLSFTSGFSSLGDGIASTNRNRADAIAAEAGRLGRAHTIKFGGEIKRLDSNLYGQQNPRGSFTFTGAATAAPGAATGTMSGSDFADFLLGIPDASSIAYGNADKYLRQTEYALYVDDDWRVLPNLSLNLGIRWEFATPISELFGRLVNLDVKNDFSAVAPVVANNPVGSLTGRHYSASLMNPDHSMIEPRVGISWRPSSESSFIVRVGYGRYANTSVYPAIARQMMQQAPLSKSLSVQNSASCPLTLANGFIPCSGTTQSTFGIDPNFRVGYAQIWKLQLQYDLPFGLQATATYLGTRGTHGAQEILPNSYPLGAMNPCPACSAGFIYESSGGNSMRHAGQFLLRRRMRSGFGATIDYTLAKSIDDDAYLGGQGQSVSATTIAQNWRNPRGERSLSAFDQRNVLKIQTQYTSGMGLHGGTLLGGWRGRALKEWTVLSTFNIGSGLPETPIYSAVLSGTGFTNILRPDLTAVPIYTHRASARLNAAAYSAPAAGQWGNAGRYSITGPGQFSFDTSLARTFRVYKNTSLDMKAVSTNLLNKVTFSSWNTSITDSLFGQPVSANSMRSVQIEMNLRFQR